MTRTTLRAFFNRKSGLMRAAVICGFIFCFFAPVCSHAAQLIVAKADGPTVQLVVASKDELLQRTGMWCKNFLEKRGMAVASRLRTTDSPGYPSWVLEVKDNAPVARSLSLDVRSLEHARGDAFILSIREQRGQPIVVIVGKNVQGVRSGVARLVALITNDNRALTAPTTTEFRQPFFPIRRLHVGTSGRFSGQDKDSLWTNWTDERIKQFAEQIWLLGYNSVEVAEGRGYPEYMPDEEVSKLAPKYRVFFQALRDNGIQVSLFIWGKAPFGSYDILCWNKPADQPIMKEEFTHLAARYGDLVDHIVVNFHDPVGCRCGLCDAYKTPQHIISFLVQAFRKHNPKTTATLSTWANDGFWRGASAPNFLDETLTPKDIAIALHRWYNRDLSKIVRRSGRAVEIWGWYLADLEGTTRPLLFMRRLDRYFSALPASASAEVRTLSVELCTQGWPTLMNAYVASQKMWTPKRSLQEIEREFCAGLFGDQNADAMVKVFQAFEEHIRPSSYGNLQPETDALPPVQDTEETARKLRGALTRGQSFSLDQTYIPNLTTATQAETVRDLMLRKLTLASIFLDARREAATAKSKGAGPEQLQRLVHDVEEKARDLRDDQDYARFLTDLSAITGTRVKLHGTVYTADRRPVAGAVVQVQGSDLTTVSNALGEWELELPAKDCFLRASSANTFSQQRRVSFSRSNRVDFELVPTGHNLLVNMGFEDWVGNVSSTAALTGSKAGWSYSFEGPRSGSIADWFRYRSGARSLVVNPGAIASAEPISVFQELAVAPDASYTAVVWVKGIDPEGRGFGSTPGDSAGLRLQELDSEGKVIIDHEGAKIAALYFDWMSLGLQIKTSPRTVRLRFSIDSVLRNRNGIMYDDCFLGLTDQVGAPPATDTSVHWRRPSPHPVGAWPN
jgi:hypothetical protein